MNALVQAIDVTKIYQTGDVKFHALRGISLELAAGEFVAVMGPSGSGKSTLLHLLGGLDKPSQGTVVVGGTDLLPLRESALAKFRREKIGFIFQFFNLIDNLTIQANVELPALLARRENRKAIRRRSTHLLEILGVIDQRKKYPWQLSGGQQQRIAIARSLINQPALLLADEPTGNLDSKSGTDVLNILSEFHQQGQAILMVTHDARAAARAQCVLFLHDGCLVDRLSNCDEKGIAQRLTEWQ